MIKPSESLVAWRHCLAVVRPALPLVPRTYLRDVGDRLAADDMQGAVARRDTAGLFDYVVRLFDSQGLSTRQSARKRLCESLDVTLQYWAALMLVL